MKELLKTCERYNNNKELVEKVSNLYKTYQKELLNYLKELENKFGTLINRDEDYVFNDIFLKDEIINAFHVHSHKDIYYITLYVGNRESYNITIPLDNLFNISLAKENLIERIKSNSNWLIEDIEDLEKRVHEYKEIRKNVQNL